VWKHYILLSLVRGLLQRQTSAPFRYLDTHAGRGFYRLAQGGEWELGIGRAAKEVGALAGHPYFRIVGSRVGSSSVYLGSWALVQAYLERAGVPYLLQLCDTSEAVAEAVREHTVVASPQGRVRFERRDGFSQVDARSDWDLVLVDPPYVGDASDDWGRCARAAERLDSRHTPYLIWYPLYFDCGPIGTLCAVHRTAYEVRWTMRGGLSERRLSGCGLIAGGGADRILRPELGELGKLAQILDGHLFVMRRCGT
jgi:23S rRNA A2030 N6-methylase RlmJ